MKSTDYFHLPLTLFSILLLFTSCSEQYNIAGNSSIGDFNGQTVYLKISDNGIDANCLDSCQVVHGQFNFIGDVDSVMLAIMYLGNQRLMPVILENGMLNIEMGHYGQRVSGSPSNDRLNAFLRKCDRIANEQWELERECSRMLLNGKSHQEVNEFYDKKIKKLEKKLEKLENEFIQENYETPLGPGCFQWLFGQYAIPIMTDQIRDLIENAPPCFRNHPYVRSYIQRARDNRSAESQ